MQWLENPAWKWLLPLPVLALLAWPVWRFFRASWLELDGEAAALWRARPEGSAGRRWTWRAGASSSGRAGGASPASAGTSCPSSPGSSSSRATGCATWGSADPASARTCVELFFRGWWLGASRSAGPAAIFLVAVPYAAIHLGKPYLEAMGAMVAGVVLGSLAIRTRSIWAGLLVHATVAVLMDVAALKARGELPTLLAPGSARSFVFPLCGALPWIAWGAAALVLLHEVRRRRGGRRVAAAEELREVRRDRRARG